MLEQERDLIAAELAALKEEAKTVRPAVSARHLSCLLTARASQLVNDSFEKQSSLEAAQGENAKLRQAYSDICQEADTLYAVRPDAPSLFNAMADSYHACRSLTQPWKAVRSFFLSFATSC